LGDAFLLAGRSAGFRHSGITRPNRQGNRQQRQ